MNKRTLLIAISAMMLFAVQGYAQRETREHVRSNSVRSESRSSLNSSPRRERRSSSYQRGTPKGRNSFSTSEQRAPERRTYTSPQRTGERTRVSAPQRNAERTRVAPSPQRSGDKTRVAPPPSSRSYDRGRPRDVYHGGYRPICNHHRSHYHHHHVCIFDHWSWYSWGNYHNRFIRHGYYHNRFFDSLLGYYLWGALETPTRIDLGDLSITRYNGRLKIFTGRDTTYLDLYRYQRIVYKVGYTSVEVTTNYGYATIYFYDEYGNTASYRL